MHTHSQLTKNKAKKASSTFKDFFLILLYSSMYNDGNHNSTREREKIKQVLPDAG